MTAADACERMGLSVPPLNEEVVRKLATILPSVGSSTRNPVDVGIPTPTPEMLSAVMETMLINGNVDILIVDEIEMYISNPWISLRLKALDRRLDKLAQVPVEIKKKFGKRVVVVLPVEAAGVDAIEYEGARRKVCDYYLGEGIPVFLTLERAAKALANLANYYKYLEDNDTPCRYPRAEPVAL